MFCAALKEVGLAIHVSFQAISSQIPHLPPNPNSMLVSTSIISSSTLKIQRLKRHFNSSSRRKWKWISWVMSIIFWALLSPGGHLSVHLSQSAFTEFTAHHLAIDWYNHTPHMTPYCSGFQIDTIPPADPKDPDLKRRTIKVYQSIVRCINWLATSTHPDVAPVLSFLASYSHAPLHQHYKSALHAVKYLNLYSTADYTAFLFTPMQATPSRLSTTSQTTKIRKLTPTPLPRLLGIATS